MDYFNNNLFPSDDADDNAAAMDQEERDLNNAIEEDDKGEETEEGT